MQCISLFCGKGGNDLPSPKWKRADRPVRDWQFYLFDEVSEEISFGNPASFSTWKDLHFPKPVIDLRLIGVGTDRTFQNIQFCELIQFHDSVIRVELNPYSIKEANIRFKASTILHQSVSNTGYRNGLC